MKVDEKIILVHHLRTVTCLTRNYAIMHRGKAAVFDGLSAEHLMYCHPLLPCILAKLFNLFLRHGHVPTQFGISYTVPLLKGSNSNYTKNLTILVISEEFQSAQCCQLNTVCYDDLNSIL